MFYSTPIVDHPHCMHDYLNTACSPKKNEDDEPFVSPDSTAVSEDEDDKFLVQAASRKELVKEKRESAAERRTPSPLRRRKGPPVWRDPSATLEQDVSGNSGERFSAEVLMVKLFATS